VWAYLERLGYDRDLYSFRSRCFTLSIQSRSMLSNEDQVEVRVRDAVQTDLDTVTSEMIIEQFGSQTASGDGYKVFEFKQSGGISSFMAINEKESPIEVTLDLSQSDQCIYSTNQAINKRTLKSKQKRFFLHV